LKQYGLLSLKIILWILGILIFLVALVFFLIRVPAVQDFARRKTVSYLQNKLGTKVEINKVTIDWPKLVVLEDVYFEDQKKDTLLAGDTLKVDISMMKLLSNTVEINEIDLRGVTANVKRYADSSFNYNYILKAFLKEQNKTPNPADSVSALKFSLDKINLDRIHATYSDAVAASNMTVYLSHFDTRVKEFDLDKMKFNIPKITLRGMNARMIQSKPAAQPESKAKDVADAAQPLNMDLTLGEIDVAQSGFYYKNDISAVLADLKIGSLNIQPEHIDMRNQRADLNNITLANSKILFQLGKKVQAKIVAKEIKQEVEAQSKFWIATVGNLNLNNNDIKFDNFNMPVMSRGIDFGHLDIKALSLGATKFVYAVDTISGNINKGSFREKSGFVLNQLKTNFFYGSKQAYFNNLYVQTNHSVIKDRIRMSYPSIESLTEHPERVRVDANLDGSRVGFKDILVFMPTMAGTEPFKSNPNAVLNVNARVNGQLSNLNIPNLEVSGLRNAHIKLSGKVTGLPDPNRAYFDLKIGDFSIGGRDLAALVPKGTIPSNIRLPESIRLNGLFKGGMSSFSTDLNLASSFGSAKAIGSYNKGRESYKANVRLFNFNVGRLIKQEKTIGKVTLAANIAGSGMDPKTMNAKFDARVIRADYNGYSYRNLNVAGTTRRGTINAKANMADRNLDFDLVTTANFNGKYPRIKMTLDMDSANFQKLGLMKDDLRFRGKIVADLQTADPDYLNGSILLTNALIARAGERYALDTVSLVSTANADSNTLDIESEVLRAHVAGKYQLTQVGTAMQALINKYFDTGGVPPSRVKYAAQRMRFDATIINGPLIAQFVPELKELSSVTLSGRFNSAAGELVVNGNAPHILYGTYNINNLAFGANTDNNKLNYSLTLAQAGSPQLQIQNTSISGYAQNNVLTTDILVKDKNKKDHYRLAGSFRSFKKDYEFSLSPNVLLDYQRWAVSPGNSIRFGNSGIQASNFTLSNNNQRMSINTTPPGFNNPLKIDFSNFKIETLTQIVKKDSLLVGGTMNGTATVSNFQTSPIFTADMNIGDFNFRGDTIGNVALKVNNSRANTLAANASITGKGNQVDLNGFYYINTSSFDMKLNVVNLNLKSIEGFTLGNLKESSGSVNGQLDITGTVDAPKVRGGLNFNNAAFTIAMLNSHFSIDDSRIGFDSDGIAFDDFTLLDSAGNTATVDGKIYTTNFTDFRFGLNVDADNFRVLNSTAKDNELYYGQLYVDTKLTISGTMASPTVDGRLKVNEGTNLSIVLPQDDPAIEERKGIVEFVNMDDPEFTTALRAQVDSLNKSDITGMDVSVNIEVDKEAEFNLVIDEANGDFVHMRGQAQLNGGIDPSGKITLTGSYVVEEGAYELSFNFIKRRFEIRKGSSITWNGEPTSADLDVTAVYIANTAPLDLVENYLGNAPQSQLNIYKQKLPFEVDLMMKGELLKPDITFGIVLPEKNYNVASEVVTTVNARLDQLEQEPSELNKQVFALLLLNRFVGENPFSSDAGGIGAESLVRESVSKILSQQLNNLAGDLLGGVDLNFDLQATDDYTTGERLNRTDLNVGLSKRLLNDRLTVNVGSTFELEGPRQAGARTSNFAGDISVQYQLSRDGRYRLRFYKKNEYQVAVQGQVVETGLSFMLVMDYNKFRELFAKASPDEKQRKRQARAEKKAARKAK
jgi:hypothetical protein